MGDGGADMANQAVDQYKLDALLDQLDVGAQQAEGNERPDEEPSYHRRSPRHPFRTTCTLRYLSGGFEGIGELAARTRNLSCGGLSVIVRRVFRVSEPTEIEIRLPNKPPLFLAGVVTFCRYAGQGYHEIGIALKASGQGPIFSDKLGPALKTYDWLQRAGSA